MRILPREVESSRLERGLAELERRGLTVTNPGEAIDDPISPGSGTVNMRRSGKGLR